MWRAQHRPFRRKGEKGDGRREQQIRQRYGLTGKIRLLAEQLRLGRLPVERMVRWYDFADINEAAHDMEQGSSVKPILRMPA